MSRSWPITLQKGQCATLQYGPEFKLDDLILLELDEAIMKEALEQGLAVKGEPNGDAVLCTNSKTYTMKRVETSNTVLLVPPPEEQQEEIVELSLSGRQSENNQPNETDLEENRLPGLLTQMNTLQRAQHGRKVIATSRVSAQIELVQTRPDISTLENLLRAQPYTQEEALGLVEADREGSGGEAVSARGYQTEDLHSLVQASSAEIQQALDDLGAVQIDGRWRVLDEKYFRTVLDMILCAAVENNWSLDSLPAADLATFLAANGGFHPAAVLYCLRVSGAPKREQDQTVEGEPEPSQTNTQQHHKDGGGCCSGDSLSGVWCLDPRRLCVHKARALLEESEQERWRAQEFMRRWQQELPQGVTPTMDMLRGEALEEQVGPEKCLVPFRADSLPRDPALRFPLLFKKRPRWEYEDLHPYLDAMQEPGKTAEGLLLKYARITKPTSDSNPVYSVR